MLNSILEFLRAVKTPMGKLIRIEGLVVMTAAILLTMSVLESFRRRSRSSVLKLLLLILDTVSASTVTYTTGLIQNSYDIKNELLQVWVVLLTTLKESNDYISAYGVEQAQDRRRRELRDLMESCWVAYLNATRGTKFKYPLWILWGLNTSKILHRIISYEHASESYSFGKNPLLTASYMKYEHTLSEPSEADPVQMKGFKYLVLGEDKQKIEPTVPGYQIRLTTIREKKLITLDKIWQCDGRLLSSSGGDKDGRLKDLCLSFAMYKLLRRRFDKDNTDEEPDHPKNRNLVLQGLLGSGDDDDDAASKRLFRVVEVELEFLTDHFYSRYPIIFSKGFPVFSIVRVVMVGAISWLLAAILIHFKWREGALRHVEHGVDVGKVITLVLLLVLIAKEAWEIATYVFSDWAKVVLICKYVEKPFLRKLVLLERLLGILCRCRITRAWHGRIGQYSLLDSFDYKPWNLGHKLTWGLVGKTKRGARRQRAIKLPDGVRRAVVDSLRSNGDRLARGRCALERNGLIRGLAWTQEEFGTNTEAILAWHIATEMLLIHGRRSSTFEHHQVAASLSRYCAYLIISNQDMLSDPPAVEFVFDDTIRELTSALKGCDSMKSKYRELTKVVGEEEGEEEPFDDSTTVVDKGARLGKFLIRNVDSDETRWKVLAEVWAELLLYIAPTSRSSTHEASLAKGGEFLTHLWALLSHAGILKKPEPYENI